MGFRVEVQVARYPISRNERGRARAVLVSRSVQPIEPTGRFGNEAAGDLVRQHRVCQRFALTAAHKDHSLPNPISGTLGRSAGFLSPLRGISEAASRSLFGDLGGGNTHALLNRVYRSDGSVARIAAEGGQSAAHVHRCIGHTAIYRQNAARRHECCSRLLLAKCLQLIARRMKVTWFVKSSPIWHCPSREGSMIVEPATCSGLGATQRRATSVVILAFSQTTESVTAREVSRNL